MKLALSSILILASAFLFGACRDKEVFPDLAKQIQGIYSAKYVSLVHYSPFWKTGDYNPTDSAQISQVTIHKIDALSVNVNLLLKKQSGQVLFQDNFDCELSRDINNKGWIYFNSYEGRAGAFIVDDGSVGYNYLTFGSRTQHGNQVSEVAAVFVVKL